MTILDFFISQVKKLTIAKRLFWQLGAPLMAIAVVEWFKQESMYGLSARTKKIGCCGEVAISRGSPVLPMIKHYSILIKLNQHIK